MKSTPVLFFFLLISAALFSQQQKAIYLGQYGEKSEKKDARAYRVVNYDANGKPVGTVYEYYINGDLKWKGKLLRDDSALVYDSICTTYYHNGNKKMVEFYVNGKREKNDTLFYYNGTVQEVIGEKNSKQEGYDTYYNRNGKKARETFFVNGSADGFAYLYSEDGKIYSRKKYAMGLQTDTAIVWFANGKIASLAIYFHDSLNGDEIEWNEQGFLMHKNYYVRGKQSGLQIEMNAVHPADTSSVTFYSKTGICILRREFSDEGKLYSIESVDEKNNEWKKTTYYDNGNIISDQKGKIMSGYQQDEGKQISFYESGKVNEIKWCEAGTPYADTIFFESGVINETNFGKYDQWRKRYDSTGVLIAENFPDTMKLTVAKDNISCFYGLKDYSGKWKVNPKYTDISEIQNGFFLVDDNEKWGALDWKGNLVVEPQYESMEILDYDDDYSYWSGDDESLLKAWDVYRNNEYVNFLVQKDEKYGLINTKNETVLPVEFSVLKVEDSGDFSYRKDTLYGYGNVFTKFISPAKYLHEVYFENSALGIFSVDSSYDYGDGYFNENYYDVGVIDYYGKVIVPPVYDKIFFQYSIDTAIWVKKNDKYGMFDIHGKKLLDTLYTLVGNPEAYAESPYESFKEETIIIRNKKFSIVNDSGKLLLPFKYDSLSITGNGVVFLHNHKYGLLGSDYKPLSHRRYSSLTQGYENYSDYDDGSWEYSNLLIACYKGKYGVVNSEDSIVLPFKYDLGFFDGNNGIEMIKGDTIHDFDAYNNEVVERNHEPEEADDAPMISFCTGLDEFNDGNSIQVCGVRNGWGKLLLPPKYVVDYVGPNIVIYHDEKDRVGILVPGHQPVLLSSKFINIVSHDEESILVTTNSGKVGVINADGKIVVDTIFYAIGYYDLNAKAWWVKAIPVNVSDKYSQHYSVYEGGWGLITTHGKYLLQPVLETPVHFEYSGLGIAKKESGTGIVDTSGVVILPLVYDEISLQSNNYFIVKKDGLYGFADDSGKIVVAPKWKNVTSFNGDYLFAYSEPVDSNQVNSKGKIELVDISGKVLTSGNQLQAYNWKISLDSLITFYGYDFLYEKYWGYSNRLQGLQFVPGRQLIKKSGLSAEKQKALANFLIALSVGDYVDFDSNFSSAIDPSFYAANEEQRERKKVPEHSYYDYQVNLVAAGKKGFSIVTCYSNCPHDNFYESHCAKQTKFHSFIYKGDSVFPVLFSDIFDTTKNYIPLLNFLIQKKMETLSDPSINCSDPVTYMKQVGDKFSYTDSTLVLWLPKSYLQPGRFYENEFVEIEIPWEDVRGVLTRSWWMEMSGKK